MANLKRMMAFVDGENLLFRFQDMLKSGIVPESSKRFTHNPDLFVWHDLSLAGNFNEVQRVSYYTTVCGDEDKLRVTSEEIKKLKYDLQNYDSNPNHGNLFPRVFKKYSREAKSKAVDINITVDILTHVHQNSVDVVYLVAGDGDYLPLIREVMHEGKQVYLAALSKGLNQALPSAVDCFVNLDPYYFPVEKQKKP